MPMSIDIFRESMTGYLKEAAGKKQEQVAGRSEVVAGTLRSEETPVEEIRSSATEVNIESGKTVQIGELIEDINHFARKLTKRLSELGIGLPPAEVLQGASYEVVLAPAQSLFTSSPQNTEQSKGVEVPVSAMRVIKSRLGNLDDFTFPPVSDEFKETGSDFLQLPIEILNLRVRPYYALKRANITKIGEVLGLSETELLYVRNFGERSLDELIEQLYISGVRPKKIGLEVSADPLLNQEPPTAASDMYT